MNPKKSFKTVEVEIFGQKYRLNGDEEESYMKEVAALVDKKMRAIGKQAKTTETTRLAVLTALNIMHDHLQSKRENRQREIIVDRKTRDMIESIEEAFEDLKF